MFKNNWSTLVCLCRRAGFKLTSKSVWYQKFLVNIATPATERCMQFKPWNNNKVRWRILFSLNIDILHHNMNGWQCWQQINVYRKCHFKCKKAHKFGCVSTVNIQMLGYSDWHISRIIVRVICISKVWLNDSFIINCFINELVMKMKWQKKWTYHINDFIKSGEKL